MTVNIIQFDPVVGGETTLCNALSQILSKEHTVRVIHPVHLTKKGLPKIDTKWGKVAGEEFLSYPETARACEDVDIIFCINAKHVKGSVKSDKRALAQADSDAFFEQFHGKDFIFYEHGFHTWRLYNYENLFSKLMEQGNSVRVLTNTQMAIDFYGTKGYSAYLCRQPFDPGQYKPIEKTPVFRDFDPSVMRDQLVGLGPVTFCFNSRYSATKGPYVILRKFQPFLGKDLDFTLRFRGNISDPVSVWHNIDGVLLKDFIRSHKEIEFLGFANDISEVYAGQEVCVYAGYQTREERGKIEYAILEPIYYDIPLAVTSEVFDYFKYEEYGITPEELRSCFIELTPENIQLMIERKMDYSSYVRNSKRILEDFMPETILRRFNTCVASPSSKGRRVSVLF